MPPVAVAGIGAAASIGGAVLGSKAQKKAAGKAADAQAAAAAQNNALTREIYGENAGRLDPFVSSGTRANNVLMELLLGPTSQGVGGTPGTPATSSQTALPAELLALNSDGIKGNFASALQAQYPNIAAMRRDGIPGNYAAALSGAQLNTPATPGNVTTTPAPSALSAWDTFRNSTNYQWRLNEGNRALNQGYAANGALDSGAARIALQERGQNFASNELGNWMNLLAQQQGVGMSAASALAGVSQNMVNNVSSNNQNAANAASNAALMNGQANANMWGGIVGGIGQIAGAFGSSYGPQGNWSKGIWG